MITSLRPYVLTSLAVFSSIFTGFTFANNGFVADKHYDMKIKYDPSSGEFYDLKFLNSLHSSIEKLSSSEIKVIHTTDNLLGTTVGGVVDQGIVNTLSANKNFSLTSTSGHYPPITGETGIKKAQLYAIYQGNTYYYPGFNNGCSTAYRTGSVYELTVIDPYKGALCLTTLYIGLGSTYTSDPTASFIERYFKFDLNQLNDAGYGTYKGTYIANNQAMTYYQGAHPQNTWNVTQNYIYHITVEIISSLAEITVTNPNLNFSVSKKNNYIEAYAETSFNINGFFNDYSKINITVTSANAGQCKNSNLCLYNASSNMSIPYELEIFEGSNSTTAKFKYSNDTGYIVPSHRNHSYGNMRFSLLSNESGLTGKFNDVLTIRASLPL
ncbi:hypothetical protein [Vibrio sp. ER1A]|uniref:hypothetical protein n=1 Tax=Vibrio sp. ER1A TaxID=1517681 RepID=UPI0004DD320F|nr:hypothetical protein [Vibrio sp. ER1A]KFA99253.1 hypothetical protein HW45_04895 [Vibrio sp. ER1A]